LIPGQDVETSRGWAVSIDEMSRAMAHLCARGERVGEAGEPGLEAEVCADAAPIEEHIEIARERCVRAVRRRRARRREERGEVGGLVIDDVSDRLARGDGHSVRARLALDAAERLASANVNTVAVDIGVSER